MVHRIRLHLLLAGVITSLSLSHLHAAEIPHSSALPVPPITTEGERGPGVPDFKVAAGYRVTLALDDRSQTRFLQTDNFGTLYISSPNHGTITSYKLQDDKTYKKIATVVTVPPKASIHGMEFVDGWLWFCTSGSVSKGKVRPDGSGLDDVTVILPEGSLPSGGGHWWRPVLVDKDGFYTSVGDARNFSDVSDPKIIEEEGPHSEDREKIWKYSLDGKTRTLFVTGIRNTEKLLFRPGTTEVWGLDHGSDDFGKLLGDDIGHHQPITDDMPGEEVNHYEQGKFYGHPFIADNNVIRPEYNIGGPNARPDIQQLLAKATPPAYLFPAHWADCGWTWLNKDSALGKRGDMFLAAHGSWDRVAAKVGYCVAKLPFTADGKPTQGQQIVSCLATDGKTFLGRPVDVIEEPGTDNLLFSVDAPRGRVYRLSPVIVK
jgi:glucose/arabinose dehydrogenase